MRKKDGTIIDVEMTQRQIQLDGRAALLTAAHDVTEQVDADKARRAAEDQLRQAQKMEAVGQLTGGIAHDFNNILMVVMANVDALLDEHLDAGLTKRVADIDKAVGRATGLTRQLLAFSRKQALHPQQTDLNTLVADTGTLLQRALGAQIVIETVLAEGLCIAYVDRAQLQTALVNLSVNARDAMPEGGRLLIETRDVTLDEDYVARNPGATVGANVMLSVTDTGIGMPPDVLDKVFEPFFTTKEVGKGTGLGLSMVYGFIKQSNGHIAITSEVRHGTSIKLYLPCSGEAVEAPTIRDKTAAGGRERILVVEDEETVRASVVEQLVSLGYVVSDAASGEAGIAALETGAAPFALLLTDVVMPGRLNGKLLAVEVARRWPTTKIVFMSGFTETASSRDGRLDDDAVLLTKPFRKSELARAIRLKLDGGDRSADAPAEAA